MNLAKLQLAKRTICFNYLSRRGITTKIVDTQNVILKINKDEKLLDKYTLKLLYHCSRRSFASSSKNRKHFESTPEKV